MEEHLLSCEFEVKKQKEKEMKLEEERLLLAQQAEALRYYFII